jgi:hypothetical protein
MPKLRVWWIPQVPGNPFYVNVQTIREGVLVMDTLSAYDLFQFLHNIKGDYANAGGLEQFIEDQWMTWYDEATGIDDPREYLEQLDAAVAPTSIGDHHGDMAQ